MRKTLAVFVMALAILAALHPAAAQQAGKVYRIGFLTRGTADAYKPWLTAFRQGLAKLGYRGGINLVIEDRYAAGHRERLPALTAELVGLAPDVIVTHGGSLARAADRAAKQAGRTIPIVFAVDADPVGKGIVASLARPGGNITGLSDYHAELVPKRLALLKEVVPSASRIAVLWSPTNPTSAPQLKVLQATASTSGVTLLPVKFANPGDVEAAFATLRTQRADALDVLGYSMIATYGKRIAGFALANRLPTIFTLDRWVAAGGLMSYGVNFPDMYRRAATFVDKILKGAKPAEMPVEQPTRFYLTVNLKTAKALGITFPRSILLRADEVIE